MPGEEDDDLSSSAAAQAHRRRLPRRRHRRQGAVKATCLGDRRRREERKHQALPQARRDEFGAWRILPRASDGGRYVAAKRNVSRLMNNSATSPAPDTGDLHRKAIAAYSPRSAESLPDRRRHLRPEQLDRMHQVLVRDGPTLNWTRKRWWRKISCWNRIFSITSCGLPTKFAPRSARRVELRRGGRRPAALAADAVHGRGEGRERLVRRAFCGVSAT